MSGARGAAEIAEQVFGLFRTRGDAAYIGEPVSQTEHALQAALLAEAEGCEPPVILGALLHDIGHLLDGEAMVTDGQQLGVHGHETRGAEFLRSLGVPDDVTFIVQGHVDAKRYQCYTDPSYHKKLSAASKHTLTHQGGPMQEGEAAVFAADPARCAALLRARGWDEAAKVQDMQLPHIDRYRDMFRKYMQGILGE